MPLGQRHLSFLNVRCATIEIYSNRIEVINPGLPVVPVERFIDTHRSRNEKLAWFMRHLNICEERGSGAPRIVRTAEDFQLPAPEFLAGYDATTVVIYGHRDFRDMTSDDKIRACYQHSVLMYIMRQQMMNESLRKRFGLADSEYAAVSRVIRATLDAGLVTSDPAVGESRKYARYLPHWATSLPHL
jgi:predicted HTH transcriptional regulator